MHFKEAYDPFRALRSAWQILKTAPSAVLVGGLLLWVCSHGSWTGLQLGTGNVNVEVDREAATIDQVWRTFLDALQLWLTGIGVIVAFLALAFAVAVWLFRCLVQVGLATAVERALTTGEDELGDLFRARGRWGSYVATSVLYTLIMVLAALPGLALAGLAAGVAYYASQAPGVAVISATLAGALYLPVLIYIALGISLAPFAVAVEGLSASESFSRSWELVRGHRWTLFLYRVVFFLPRLCCCYCCLLFFPTSMIETAEIESYLRLVNAGEPGRWRSPAAPPLEPPPA